MSHDVADLRREYEQEERIGPLLYALLNQIVVRTVHIYPAAIYSPDRTQKWTPEGCAGVAHAWTAERLLGPARLLERDLDEASTYAQLESHLVGRLREYLADTLAPDGARTMRKRVITHLQSSGSASTRAKRPRHDGAIWTVTGRAASAPAARDDLERLAWKIPDARLDLLRDHHPQMRSTPHIRGTGLATLVDELMDAAGTVRLGDLVAAVCSRLQLPDPGRLPQSLEADDWTADRLVAPGAEVEYRMDELELGRVADAVVKELPHEARLRLLAYLDAGEQDTAAANALGVHPKTIKRTRDALRALIVVATHDATSAIKVYDRVLLRLREWRARPEAGTAGEER